MPDSNSLRDLRRAKNSAPSQGWQGPRTKWSGARENSTSHVDPPPPASPSGSTSANPYASSGPYASALHQQNVAAGATDAGHSRTRDASSRFAERYAGQRSYSADPVAAVADQPKRGNSWSSWLGGKEKTEPAHSRTSSSNSPTPDKPRGSRDDDRLPERPRRGRYIPPSERKPGDPMFEPVAPPPRRGPRTSDPEDDEPDPDDNSWGAWAARQTKAANAMMQTASEKLNEGWDSVNDAGKRDKVGLKEVGLTAGAD